MPFLAPIGYALGVGAAATATTAAVGTAAASLVGAAVVGGTAAFVGSQVYGTMKQVSASKKAANEASALNTAAMKEARDIQSTSASKAQESLFARRRASAMSQTVYTSPLGISGQATTAKKQLLGQ